jgi:hypothetical protein
MEHRLEHQPVLVILALVLVIVCLLISTSNPPVILSAYPPPIEPTAANTPLVPTTNQIYLPLVQRRSPQPAPSYYVTDLTTLYDLGYALGVHDKDTPGTQDNLVILDYGYPAKQGSEYGAFLVFDQTGTFYSSGTVILSTIEFARGYYIGTGTDYFSHLRMVIGVNNCCNENTLSFFQGHGAAWGQLINSVRSGILLYSSQVDVVGGSDIEMDYNDPYATTQWFSSFLTANTCIPGSEGSVEGCFYNFGNLAISISGTSCAINRTSSWVACDVWYVSWGAQKNGKRFARPLPEIYHGTQTLPPWGTDAKAWKDLSLFSANQMNAGKM